MQGCRDALDYCGFKDLGCNGFPFTWCNKRLGDHNVWIRLDRGVANSGLVPTFPHVFYSSLGVLPFEP